MVLKRTLSSLHPLFVPILCFTITLSASNMWLGVCEVYVNSSIMDLEAPENNKFPYKVEG